MTELEVNYIDASEAYYRGGNVVEEIRSRLEGYSIDQIDAITLWIEDDKLLIEIEDSFLYCELCKQGQYYESVITALSIKQLQDILFSFLDDQRFFAEKHGFKRRHSVEELKHKPSAKEYSEWKKRYGVSRKKARLANMIKGALAFTVVISIFVIGYLGINGELPFLLRETQTAKAIIVKTSFRHSGSGYYKQRVRYVYEFQNQKFEGYFDAGKREGLHQEGDVFLVKFVAANPSRSKPVWRTKSTSAKASTNLQAH